jgi:hypothetical protein
MPYDLIPLRGIAPVDWSCRACSIRWCWRTCTPLRGIAPIDWSCRPPSAQQMPNTPRVTGAFARYALVRAEAVHALRHAHFREPLLPDAAVP